MGLVGGLIVMVMYSSYENFVSRMNLDDGKDEKLGWLGKMDAGSLKKQGGGKHRLPFSSIHLLRIFMDIQSIANDKLLWYVVLHLTFVLLSSLRDVLHRHHHEKVSLIPTSDRAPEGLRVSVFSAHAKLLSRFYLFSVR